MTKNCFDSILLCTERDDFIIEIQKMVIIRILLTLPNQNRTLHIPRAGKENIFPSIFFKKEQFLLYRLPNKRLTRHLQF